MNDSINLFLSQVAEALDLNDPTTIDLESKFRDFEEWSSLSALCIISLLDEEYDKSIKNEDLKNCQTLGDIYNLTK